VNDYPVTAACGSLRAVPSCGDAYGSWERVPYGYRHTFATDALANGVSDAHIAELLGHSVAMLGRHYSHLVARTGVLKAALGRVR
jgi:integrase